MSNLVDLKMRYEQALLALKSGASFKAQYADPEDTTAVSLRSSVDAALSDIHSIARLLIRKGLMTEKELFEALVEGIEAEVKNYQAMFIEHFNMDVDLT